MTVGSDAETLAWTPVECCVGVICACIPCMAPLRRHVPFIFNHSGYRATGTKRAKDLPLAAAHTWPREHSVLQSTHTRDDVESGEVGEGCWTAKMNGISAHPYEGTLNGHVHPPHWRGVVVNGASAAPNASGASIDLLPDNQIQVIKDLEWTSETVTGDT